MKEYIFLFLLSFSGTDEITWSGGTFNIDGTYECHKYCEYAEAAKSKVAVLSSEYKRSYFQGWIDADKDCQDSRTEVLIRDAINPEIIQDLCDFTGITGAVWELPYSGSKEINSSKIDVDHVVPLEHAYSHGANKWSTKMRSNFSNDLDNLLATTASENRSKGSRGPDEWKPPQTSYWCEYATRWVYIKMKYFLEVTKPEMYSLKIMWETCQ